jgi:hypothetical protein
MIVWRAFSRPSSDTEESTPMDSHERELKSMFWEALARSPAADRATFLCRFY